MPRLANLFALPLALLTLSQCTSSPADHTKSLPKLLVQRLGWMDEVAQVKQAKSLPVNDPVREAALLKAMEQKGAAAGVPATAIRPFFEGQIIAAKVYQEEWLKQHATTPPTNKPLPDLTKTVRPALDQIGGQMIAELQLARATKNAAPIFLEAQRRLDHAGYSRAVSAPVIQGLKAGLTNP